MDSTLTVMELLKRKEGEIAALYAALAGVLALTIDDPNQQDRLSVWLTTLQQHPSRAVEFADDLTEREQEAIKDGFTEIISNLERMLHGRPEAASPTEERTGVSAE